MNLPQTTSWLILAHRLTDVRCAASLSTWEFITDYQLVDFSSLVDWCEMCSFIVNTGIYHWLPSQLIGWLMNCLQSHGFEHMVTFFNLKKLGILVEQESSSKVAAVKLRRSQFRQLSSKLGLVSNNCVHNIRWQPDPVLIQLCGFLAGCFSSFKLAFCQALWAERKKYSCKPKSRSGLHDVNSFTNHPAYKVLLSFY